MPTVLPETEAGPSALRQSEAEKAIPVKTGGGILAYTGRGTPAYTGGGTPLTSGRGTSAYTGGGTTLIAGRGTPAHTGGETINTGRRVPVDMGGGTGVGPAAFISSAVMPGSWIEKNSAH